MLGTELLYRCDKKTCVESVRMKKIKNTSYSSMFSSQYLGFAGFHSESF